MDDFGVVSQTEGVYAFSGLNITLPNGQSLSLSGEVMLGTVDVNVREVVFLEKADARRVLEALVERTGLESPGKAKDLHGILVGSKHWDLNDKDRRWRNMRIVKKAGGGVRVEMD